MKFLLANSLMVFLLNIPYVIGCTSYIRENATLKLDPESELRIQGPNILANSGTITAASTSIIDTKGSIKNNNIVTLEELTNIGRKDFVIAGTGEIQVKNPKGNATISSIKIKNDAFQTILGEGENASSKIIDLQIDGTLEKQSSLTLDVEKSNTKGCLILNGDVVFQ